MEVAVVLGRLVLTTWRCVVRTPGGGRLVSPAQSLPVALVVKRSLRWGGVNGMLFLAGGSEVSGFVGDGARRAATAVPLLLLLLLILPFPLAFLLGAVAGLTCCGMRLGTAMYCRRRAAREATSRMRLPRGFSPPSVGGWS